MLATRVCTSGMTVCMTSQGLVSEPKPRKIGKEGLVNRAGWKCTLKNVRNFITC